MIKILTLFITLYSSLSFAEPSFEEHKARTLKFIAERETTIAAHKSCVEKATTNEEIRECNKQQRMTAMKQKQMMKKEKKETK